jgi:hypothetical protein
MRTRTVALLVLFGLLPFVGCGKSPNSFDPTGEEWELWCEGVVKSKIIQGDGGYRTFNLEFDSGFKLRCYRFHNWLTFEEGDKGAVYRFKGGWNSDIFIVLSQKTPPLVGGDE